MRKTLTAVLLALTLPAVAMAMPKGEHRGGDHGFRPFKELNLSREQHQQIQKLMADEMKALRDINQRYLDKLPEADKKAMQDEIKASKDKQRSGIRALLNADQQKTYDELVKKMEERRAEREEFSAWKAQKDKAAQ